MWKPRRSSERKFKTFSELFEFPMKILLNDFVFHLPSNCLNGTFFKVCSKSLRQIIMKSSYEVNHEAQVGIDNYQKQPCSLRVSNVIGYWRAKIQSEGSIWSSLLEVEQQEECQKWRSSHGRWSGENRIKSDANWALAAFSCCGNQTDSISPNQSDCLED